MNYRARAACDPLLIFFSFPWLDAHGNCQRPGGVGSRGVRGMDAAAKPQGRVHGVPANPPARPSAALLLASATNPQPRGAAPLAGNSVPLDPRHRAAFNLRVRRHRILLLAPRQARLFDRRPVPAAQRPGLRTQIHRLACERLRLRPLACSSASSARSCSTAGSPATMSSAWSRLLAAPARSLAWRCACAVSRRSSTCESRSGCTDNSLSSGPAAASPRPAAAPASWYPPA